MKNSFKAILALIAVVSISLLVSQETQEMAPPAKRLLQTYTTTSTRSSSVGTLCPANLDRTTLVSQSDVTTAKTQRTAVDNQLGINGNTFINYLANGQSSEGITYVQNSSTNLGIYMGVFFLGFIIFILIWPFLCCCCTCPSCCPSKCCQKAPEEQYSKCELYWPAVTLILALLLTMSASIYGFTNVTSFGPAIKNFGCSTAIIVDDLLNGNVTASGSTFFTGLNTLNNQIGNLNTQLTNINGNFSDFTATGAGSISDTALTDCTTVRDQVKAIPNTVSPFQLVLAYNSPIDGTTGSTTSTFIPVLGDYLNTSSLVGALYTTIDATVTLITNTRSSASSLSTHSASVSSAVAGIQSSITSIVNSVNSADSGMGSALSGTGTVGDNANMGLQAFYGIFIGFSFFALLGALLTVCCDKYGCRYLMYFSCIFLFLAGIIGFLVVSFISFLLPVVTWGCSYLDVTLATDVGFTTNMKPILGTSVSDQLKLCMPFGNGSIIDAVASGNSLFALNNLTSVIGTMGSYNNTQLQNQLQTGTTAFINTVGTWCRGEVVDLDSTNYAVLQTISNPSDSGWTSCNAQFTADSWIPSNSQNSSYAPISCQVSSGNTGDTTTCTATLTNNGGNTCAGCMDTTSLEPSIATGAINGVLNTRYGAACTFNAKMTNVWSYYNTKNTALGPTGGASTVLGRANAAKVNIQKTTAGGVFFSLTQLDTLFTNINSSMIAINNLVDPKTGLVAGLNCNLFGQDFVRIQEVMCGSMYYNMYVIRYALGISCYGVLFSMCCIVCTGVRHYKHGERKNKIGDAFFKGKDDPSGHNLHMKE